MRLFLLMCVLSGIPLRAADWPQFRGINSSGMADAPAPVKFGPGKNELWHVPVLSGHSSPCVVGDRIFLTTFDSEKQQLAVLCVDRQTGSTVWMQTVEAETIEKGHPSFNPASSTVACDGEYVVAYFGSCGLLCFDMDGNKRWDVPMSVAESYGGNAVSPIITGDHVILYRGCYAEHFLLAVDRRTGEERWKVQQQEKFSSNVAATATPIVYENQVIVHGARAVQSFDVKSGDVVWSVSCSTTGTSTPVIAGHEVIVGTWNQTGEPSLTPPLESWDDMVTAHDENANGTLEPKEFPRLFIFHRSEGTEAPQNGWPLRFRMADGDKDGHVDETEWDKQRADNQERRKRYVPHGMLVIDLSSRGTLMESDLRRLAKEGIPEVPSPLVHQGAVYYVKNGGVLTCLDLQTGKRRSRLRTGGRGTHYASPLIAGDHLYSFAGNGHIAVVAISTGMKVVEKNRMDTGISATPAIVDGVIYLRTHNTLWAFAE